MSKLDHEHQRFTRDWHSILRALSQSNPNVWMLVYPDMKLLRVAANRRPRRAMEH
jgi:hypothetical protein